MDCLVLPFSCIGPLHYIREILELTHGRPPCQPTQLAFSRHEPRRPIVPGGDCSLFVGRYLTTVQPLPSRHRLGNAAASSSTLSQASSGMYRPVRDAHQEEVADGEIYQPRLQGTSNADTDETFPTTPKRSFALLGEAQGQEGQGQGCGRRQGHAHTKEKRKDLEPSSGHCRPSPQRPQDS